MKTMPLVLLLLILSLGADSASAQKKFEDFQALGVKSGLRLNMPAFPTTLSTATNAAPEAIALAEKRLAGVVALGQDQRSFAATFGAIDRVMSDVAEINNILQTVSETATSKELRDAARSGALTLDQWSVEVTYREDLYKTLSSAAHAKAPLNPEEQRDVMLVMREYRRAGMALPRAERADLEKLQKELAALNTEFHQNINEARATLDFTSAELEGVPDSLLNAPGVKQENGRFRIQPNITLHFKTIEQKAKNPETRRRVMEATYRLAREKNGPLLARLVSLRGEIARRLGYASWADYQTEVKMTRNGATAVAFEKDLVARLETKFQTELGTLRALKAKETKNADAPLEAWDIDYYVDQLLKDQFAVDTEAMRSFFPYQQTVDGMMSIYQRIFGLKFTEVEPPYRWAPGVQLYVAQDAKSGELLGAFYLDMFPREGKYNHFACFPQMYSRPLTDGSSQLPVMALICNFQPPTADKPSLLKHSEVVTLFHEFGHAIHGLTSRSHFLTQAAFAVPGDFVEAPSQMLENWVWEKDVLDTFAADYRNPALKIPAETVAAMVRARQATEAVATRRQLWLGLSDLEMHTASPEKAKTLDPIEAMNNLGPRIYLAPPANTSFATYFGHLAGYDAGYYGYQWAKSLSQDMASVFRKSPKGFLDEKIGRRLRDEVYAVGYTRDVDESVERFLGRKPSSTPFLQYLGVVDN
jgi:thimet oligopeptidase